MHKMKYSLSKDDLDAIIEFSEFMADQLKLIERVKQFSVGDYVVATRADTKQVLTDQYNVAYKFLVVYTNEMGAVFVKRVLSKNRLSGNVFILHQSLNSFSGYEEFEGADRHIASFMDYSSIEFILDPEYAAATLLECTDSYDPSVQQTKQSDLRREILAHNRSIKIPTKNGKDIKSFMDNLRSQKYPNVIWFSNRSYMTISSVTSYQGTRTKITGVTNKNKTITMDYYDILNKALYTAQPRSLNELKHNA